MSDNALTTTNITDVPAEISAEELKSIELSNKIIRLYSQGRLVSDIIADIKESDDCDITHNDVFNIIKKHDKAVEKFITDNPNFFDDKVSRIVRRIQDYNIIEFSLWDEYFKISKNQEHNTKDVISILDTIRKVIADKNKVEQIVQPNVEIIHKIRLAEEAQSGFISLVKNVISQCPTGHCPKELKKRLSVSEIIVT